MGFYYQQYQKKLSEASVTLIALIDRIRVLDNDIIRLQQKLDTVIELRNNQEKEDGKKKFKQEG